MQKKDINRPISVTLIQFISESASITLSDMLKTNSNLYKEEKCKKQQK